MTNLLGPKPLRALSFVRILNEQGIEPTASETAAFTEASTINEYDPHTEGYYRGTVRYLRDAGLLEYNHTSHKVKLTPIGEALLKAEDIDGSSQLKDDPIEAVGRMNDPFVYAELLTRIDNIGAAMVIDPYLSPIDLSTLLRLPSCLRFLTRDQGAAGLKKPQRKSQLRIALGARPDRELRFADATDYEELHDRLVIPIESEEALMFGTSLGGKQLTVITRLGKGTTSALREHYLPIWENGTPAEPIHRENSEPLEDHGDA